MRFASKSLGVALASLGLLGVFGCAEDNSAETGKEQGKVDENTPKATDYSKMRPQPGAQTTNPYEQSGGGGSYPGKGKPGAPKGAGQSK